MTRRHKGAVLAVGLLLLGLTGCGGASTDPEDLEGTWVLTEFRDEIEVAASVEVTVSLRDGRLGGNGGVSDLTGGYRADEDGGLTFKDVGTNTKPGSQEAMDQEGRLVETLREVASFEVEEADGDDPAELDMMDSSGAVVLSFVAKS